MDKLQMTQQEYDSMLKAAKDLYDGLMEDLYQAHLGIGKVVLLGVANNVDVNSDDVKKHLWGKR